MDLYSIGDVRGPKSVYFVSLVVMVQEAEDTVGVLVLDLDDHEIVCIYNYSRAAIHVMLL